MGVSKILVCLLFVTFVCNGTPASAQVEVKTIAGSSLGFSDGALNAARFSYPYDVWIDSAGNIFLTDTKTQRVRKISPGYNARVSTVAGSGVSGYNDANGTSAQFNDPKGIVGDRAGNLYITDSWNNKIRKISPSGDVSTVPTPGLSLNEPIGITIDKNNNLYVADFLNHRIVKINAQDGKASVLAGTGISGSLDGPASSAQFEGPSGIAIDENNNLYITDFFGHNIRKISNTGIVTTIAGAGRRGFKNDIGTEAVFSDPHSVKIIDSFLFISDRGNNIIRMMNVKSGTVTTYAGNRLSGTTDGLATDARFNYPQGFFISKNGDIVLADNLNHRIRLIESDKPKPVANFSATDVCEGEKIEFTNSSSKKGIGALTYQWFFGNGDSSFMENPVYKFDSAGTYNVTLIAYASPQSADTFSSIVKVFAKPNAKFSTSINGKSVSFIPSDTTLTSYTWHFGNGKTSTEKSPKHVYINDSTYAVKLIVKNKNGCESEVKETIKVYTSATTFISGLPANQNHLQIFPNPSSGLFTVKYKLENVTRVRTSIYDLSGKEVAFIADCQQAEGEYTYILNADDLKLKPGIYILNMQLGDSRITEKIIRY